MRIRDPSAHRNDGGNPGQATADANSSECWIVDPQGRIPAITSTIDASFSYRCCEVVVPGTSSYEFALVDHPSERSNDFRNS
jgi:hypothetical protein